MPHLPSLIVILLAVWLLAACGEVREAADKADEVEDRISDASVDRWCYKVQHNPTRVAEQLESKDAAEGLRAFCAARTARQLAATPS